VSWRARLAGWRVVVAPASRVAHRYEFSKSTAKMYFMERNRFLVLAWCYHPATLALVAPALLAMELGLWLFAARAGWWREKGRAYRYLLAPRRWAAIRESRRRVQALRRVSDREATALFVGEVVFPAVSPWLLTAVANPIFRAYWRGVRALMRW
jgi:GT2 family glycosyltransferase